MRQTGGKTTGAKYIYIYFYFILHYLQYFQYLQYSNLHYVQLHAIKYGWTLLTIYIYL